MNKCAYCINKDACGNCDDTWHDKFIPNDDVKKYFSRGYNGVRGINGYTWDFDTTNEILVSTHSIHIYSSVYCPYCGEKMFPIQDELTLDIIGYCCVCEGARAELEYEAKLKELKQKFETECTELKNQYSEKLEFNTKKLLSIKHKIELSRLHGNFNHFSMINGKEIHSIEEM